jgi:transposase InsO family protein
MITFAKLFTSWKTACLVVRPETVLKWHRDIAKMLWSHSLGGRPTIPAEIKNTIFRIKKENRLWGPARIHGELLKLGIEISESSVRNVLKHAPNFNDPNSQRLPWREFIGRHKNVWAMDFFSVHSATFRQLRVLVIMNIHTREIISLRACDGVTKDGWVSNILRHEIGEQTDSPPALLIHDRDLNFRSEATQAVLKSSGIKSVRTPYRAPLANCFVERLNGTLQRECTDHFLFFNARQLERTLQEYKESYNRHRPHQGLDQKIPMASPKMGSNPGDPISLGTESDLSSLRFLNGLHHSYFRKAA